MSTEFPTERTAIVTGVGAPRGIGRVVARRLAAEGWSLALIDIDESVAVLANVEYLPHDSKAQPINVDGQLFIERRNINYMQAL